MRDAAIVDIIGNGDEGTAIPPARRKRRSPEEIRRRLLDAAREEFKAKGFARATTAAIARRSEVAEIQMFRYFPTKNDLFREAVFAPLCDHVVSFNATNPVEFGDGGDARKRGRRYLAHLIAFLGENARLLVSLLAAQSFEQSGPGGEEGLRTYFEEAIRVMVERTPGPVPPEQINLIRAAFGTVLGCVTYRDWLFPDAPNSVAAIETAITEFVLQGLSPHWYAPADD